MAATRGENGTPSYQLRSIKSIKVLKQTLFWSLGVESWVWIMGPAILPVNKVPQGSVLGFFF